MAVDDKAQAEQLKRQEDVQAALRQTSTGGVLVVLVMAGARAVRIYVSRQIVSTASRYNLNRVVTLLVILAIADIGLTVFFQTWFSAAISPGLLSLVLGIALQTPMTSFTVRLFLLVLFNVLFLGFGVTLVLNVLGLKHLMQGRERTRMQIATVTAVAGLNGYGSFAIVGSLMVFAAGRQPGAAASAASTLALRHTLLTIAPVAAVGTTALWGWAAAKTHSLPATVCYIVIGASLLRLATMFTQLPILVLLQLGGSAVWRWWLGIALLHRRANGAAVGARAAA